MSDRSTQISASRGRLLEWRSGLGEGYRTAFRYLLLRIGMLALALVLIFGLSELWRRATMRYVQDLRRRRQFLLLRRVVVSAAVALLIVLSFATEFGSLATFAGFSAAGIAIAMQSVILSFVAYFCARCRLSPCFQSRQSGRRSGHCHVLGGRHPSGGAGVWNAGGVARRHTQDRRTAPAAAR